MYDNTQGVAAFWLPRPADAKKEPMIFVLATQGAAGLEVSLFISMDEDSTIFSTQPNFDYWRQQVRMLRVKDLDQKSAAAYRNSVLANFLADAPVEFFAVTGNADLVPAENLPFTKLKVGYRAEAEKIEADLRESGRLIVHENPAFDWLRGMDSKGPAATCFLQAIYLAEKKNLTAASLEEREQKYMDSVTSGGQFFNFKKE